TMPHDRREFISFAANGLGAVALASLLSHGSRALAGAAPAEARDAPPHFPPRARRAIHIVLNGGLSQVDSFDYKPQLARFHGKPLGSSEKPDVFFGKVGLLRQSDWEFRRRGESGLWISELFPNLASVADELTIINSMFAE